MFYNMYYPFYNFFNAIRQVQSAVRILHASPNAPAVDIYANGSAIARGLSYTSFTEYLKIPSGNYRIEVFPAGQTQGSVIDTNISIAPNTISTIVAVGLLPNTSLLVVPDTIMPIPQGRLYVRAAHLSPDVPRIDITLPDGTKVFTDTGYREVTDYISISPGTYILEARAVNNGKVVLYVPNIRLSAGKFYTLYIVGLAEGTPPLQMLIPLDGNSYIKF